MPAIKLKKAAKEYMAEKEREKEAAKVPVKTEITDEAQDEVIPKESTPHKKRASDSSYLDAEVLYEKRKRTMTPVEQALQSWLDLNLTKKEGVYIPFQRLYKMYTDSLLQAGSSVVDIPEFNRNIRNKFGKEFGLKEDSQLKNIVKEKNINEQKKVLAPSLSLKMKDILKEIIEEQGSPLKGLSFQKLQKLVGSKYPALQVDIHPKKLLFALETGVRFNKIQLVRGAGKCGYYRLFGESTAEEDIKPKEEKKKGKQEKEKNTDELSADETKESEANAATSEDATKDDNEPDPNALKKKKGKRKSSSEEGAGSKQETKEGEEGSTGNTSEKENGQAQESGEPKKKKAKKSRKSSRKSNDWIGSLHAEPQKIEDSFPLAVTYMSDPKETTGAKIRKYVSDYFPNISLDKLAKALEKGIDQGKWQKLTGSSVLAGTFRLLLEDFDPSNDENLDDIICQAFIATSEPKQASVLYLKKYIAQYHPEFNIEAKPHLFKKALERAAKKKILRQLTGVGASGTFELVGHFVPSPAMLSGNKDAELEEKEVALSENPDYIASKFKKEPKEGKQEVYIVRKTKSGRVPGRKFNKR